MCPKFLCNFSFNCVCALCVLVTGYWLNAKFEHKTFVLHLHCCPPLRGDADFKTTMKQEKYCNGKPAAKTTGTCGFINSKNYMYSYFKP